MANKDIEILRASVEKLVPLLAGKGIKVTQRGTKAFVAYSADGKPQVVNLPMLPDEASEALVLSIQGFLDHEVAHLLFTDPQVAVEANKLDAEIANLHNIIEDTFIEAQMQKKFPGSSYNIVNLHNFFVKAITEPDLPKCKTAADFVRVLVVPAFRACAGQEVFERFMNEDDKWSLIESFTKKLGGLEKKVPDCKSSRDCLELAIDIFNALSREASPEDEDEDEEKGSSSGSGGSGGKGAGKSKGSGSEKLGRRSGSGGGSSSKGDAKKERYDAKKAEEIRKHNNEVEEEAEKSGEAEDETSPSHSSGGGREEESEEGDYSVGDEIEKGEEEEGEEEEEEEEESEGEEESEDESFSAEDLKDMLSPKDFDGAIAEEISKEAIKAIKEADYIPYSKDFDVVAPFKVDSKTYKDKWLETLEDTTRHMTGVMQKDLERLVASRSRVVKSGGHRSGRLNGPALHRVITGDDRAFFRKHDARSRDTAVELVVDCSGSMSGGKIEVAMMAAFALSSVLDRLNIKHEVVGFTTGGYLGRPGWYGSGMPAEGEREIGSEKEEREMIESGHTSGVRWSRKEALFVPIFKGFDERLNPAVKRRFAACSHAHFLCNNIDGECVEIAGKRLLSRKEGRKVMIVMSDGQPAGDADPHVLRNHLRKVVQDMEKSGVEIIGLGILTHAVKDFYPKWVVLENINQLPTTVMAKLREVLLK